ncbi:MAG TPA: ABC transporter permease [Caldisericia bacterium]|nr:ABC transporter permease [Caldisericia bacterium]HON83176.1 ABC transporter permease [Caldisericia bacterium]
MDDKELFEFVGKEELQIKEFVRPSVSYWSDAWRRLKKNRFAMIGLVLIIILIVFAIIGPIISPYEYDQTDLNNVYAPMSWKHIFGTDELGRDVLTRVLYGARISLAVGFVASFLNLIIGVIYGGISGYIGGRVDNIMMRIVDILYSVPILLIVILLMVVLRPGLTNVFIALGIAYWVGMARIVRGQVLSLKEQEFTLAAKALGADRKRILLKHLIPNTIGPIIITATLLIPDAIFFESFLSFIGLGVSAPMASWGVLASDGVRAFRSHPNLFLVPSLFICITMLSFNFLGDGLRDSLDPRLRK